MAENDSSLQSVIVSFSVNAAISIGLFMAFSSIRTTNTNVYEPKTKYTELTRRPAPIKKTFWGWLDPVLKIEEVKNLDKNGLDATMFLRFVSLSAHLFTFMTILAIPLILIHFFAPNLDRIEGSAPLAENVLAVSLNRITLQNIAPGSNLLFIHAACAWLFTLYAFHLIKKTWEEYIEMRKLFFESTEFQSNYSNRILLFTANPIKNKSTQGMKDYLVKANLPYEAQQILIGRDFTKLSALVAKHKDLTARFEKVLVKYLDDPEKLPSKRPRHKEGAILGIFGGMEPVDSIDYFKKILLCLEREIYTERAKRDDDYDPDSSCFVSFEDIRAAHINLTTIVYPFSQNVIVKMFTNEPSAKICPSFDDIIWENIGIDPALKRSRKFFGTGLTFALTISWVLIMSSLNVISKWVTFDNVDPKFQKLAILIQSLIIPLLTAILNIALPYALRYIARIQGVQSKSGVERSSLVKFFIFQIWQYVVQIGASIIRPFFENILRGNLTADDINLFFKSLSSNFISTSTFFITLIAGAATFFGIEILQGAPLIFRFLSKRMLSTTPRDIYELNATPKFDYVAMYGVIFVPFLTGLCYSLVAPLIVPLVALTMCGAYITLKYQIFYVYETQNESGGIWWPRVFNLVCVSLGMFQVTTFGSLVVKTAQQSIPGKSDGKLPNLLVAILPFLTLVFWVYCTIQLKPKSNFPVDRTGVVIVPEREERFNNEILKDRVFNPAIVKLLPKIWLRKEMIPYLDTYYKPDYNDVIDYVRQTNPSRLSETKRQEITRQATQEVQVRVPSQSTLSNAEDPGSPNLLPPEYAGFQSQDNAWQPHTRASSYIRGNTFDGLDSRSIVSSIKSEDPRGEYYNNRSHESYQPRETQSQVFEFSSGSALNGQINGASSRVELEISGNIQQARREDTSEIPYQSNNYHRDQRRSNNNGRGRAGSAAAYQDNDDGH